MKYWVGVRRITGDACKDMFDFRSYQVNADTEEEACEKGRALALADDPESTNLQIAAQLDHEGEFTWRKKTYELLEQAADEALKHPEVLYIGGLINEAIRTARLDMGDTTSLCVDDLRSRANKTQREISNEIGMALNNYARIERGEADVRKMSLENALKLCEVLRITPFELMNAGDNSRKERQEKMLESTSEK